MRRQSNEVVEEVMSRRKVDICGLYEVSWRGASGRLVEGKDSRYKVLWVGNEKGMGDVGMLLVEKWVEAISGVTCVPDRIMLIKLVVGEKYCDSSVGLCSTGWS